MLESDPTGGSTAVTTSLHYATLHLNSDEWSDFVAGLQVDPTALFVGPTSAVNSLGEDPCQVQEVQFLELKVEL